MEKNIINDPEKSVGKKIINKNFDPINQISLTSIPKVKTEKSNQVEKPNEIEMKTSIGRIIFFCETFPGTYTGGRYHALLFAMALAESGLDIVFVSNEMPKFHMDFVDYKGAGKITWIIGEHWGKNLFFEKFDFVVGVPYEGLEHASYFAETKDLPLIALFFDTPNWMQEYKNDHDTTEDFWKGSKQSLVRASVIIHSTEMGKDYFNKWMPNNLFKHIVIPPSINSIVADQVSTKRIENEVTMISRPTAHKGLFPFLRSFEPEGKIVFNYIGGKLQSHEEKNLRMIEKEKPNLKINLHKLITDKEKFEIIKRSHLVIAPSSFEGFGLTLAEAVYCGTPVVAFDLPVYEENFHQTGVSTVPLRDAKKFSELVNEKLTEDFDNEKIRNKAKQFSFEKYAKKVYGKIVDPIYGNVTGIKTESKAKKVKGDICFSIITPVFNTPLIYLNEMIQSIKNQTYGNWNLILINDGSGNGCRKRLHEISENDSRIKLIDFEENKGIAFASTEGLKHVSEGWVGFVDSDDRVNPNLFAEVYAKIENNKRIKMVYTNEQKINKDGRLIEKVNKPDWNRDFFWQGMFINHFKCFDSELLKKVSLPSDKYKGSQDYDYFLRITEQLEDDQIAHVSKILIDWRIHNSNFSSGQGNRELVAHEFAKKAVKDSMVRTKFKGRLLPCSTPGFYQVYRDVIGKPKVGIFLLTKEKATFFKACLDSIERETNDVDYNIHILHHQMPFNEGVKVVKEVVEGSGYLSDTWKESFNYSKMNNFLIKKYGHLYDYIVLLNDDVVVSGGWLRELLSVATQNQKIGIVGMQLLFPQKHSMAVPFIPSSTWKVNGFRIQHAGVHLCPDIGATHEYYHFDSNTPAANFVRKVGAVTFAAALIRKEVYNQIKLDETLEVDFNDIDYCLQAESRGFEIFYTPWAKAFHFETATREGSSNIGNAQYFKKKWQTRINKNKPSAERIQECHKGL